MASKETVEKTQPLRGNGKINLQRFLYQYCGAVPNSPRPDNTSAPSAPCLHNAAMSNKKYNEEQIAQHYKKERKDLMDRARFGYHFDRKENNAPILAHLLKPHNPKEKPLNLTS